MRIKLFKENYELLSKVVGELLTDVEPKFYLIHKPELDEDFSEYGASAEKVDESHMKVSTFYYMDNLQIASKGEIISDPEITILFNNDLKIARITDFYIDNPKTAMLMGKNNGVFQLHFDCTENSEETEEEREYNDYLNEWLKEYEDVIQSDKSYFLRKEIKAVI